MARSLKWHIYHRTLSIMDAGWCEGALATDSKAVPVAVESPKAQYFCAVGALRRAEWEFGTDIIRMSRRSAEIWMAKNDQEGKKAVQRLIRQRMARVYLNEPRSQRTPRQ